MLNALSVDVEDWFQVGAFEHMISREDWECLPCRVERNCDAVLVLFEESGVRATFFILGWLAERYPALIRGIAEAGHEIASHGYDHRRVFTFTPEEFRQDLRKSRQLIEDAAGRAVTGYRAPSFSIDARTSWAHAVLAEEGYAYSSSVAPVRHDHYGWPEAPRFAFLPVKGNELVELPVTTARFAGRTLAAGGGGFFRLLPYGFSKWAIRQVNGEGRPAIIYFHPWELDPDQPRVAAAPLRSRLRHYSRLSAMESKLRKATEDFRWGRIDQILSEERAKALAFPPLAKAA
ncbi:MAG TPA: XrtA system polysaccharide deacetylase [Rhizorhapis sp.]|nr:XrtA system polysaccharide deacetylase [Rhizorhapis sp.]